MSDPMTPDVRDWMKRTDVEPPDAHESARRVRGRLPGVRQRRRWWPFPVFYRKPESTTAENLTSIAATDGQTPTITGRTRSMISPVTAITTGALVFAIGGAFLIAQPFDQQGNVPGAESGVAAAPAWVTATVLFSSNCDFGDTATEDGVTQERGMSCQGQTWTSDDPRLDGRANLAHNADSFDVDGQGYSLVTSAIEVITDEGGWQCTNADRVVSPADTLFQTSRLDGDRLSCVGYGDNDGLSAILVIDFMSAPKTVEGLIFPGEMPPMPEFPSSE